MVCGELCPNQAWISRKLTPASSRWVAQEWHKVWTLACFWMPLVSKAARNARCTLLSQIGVVTDAHGRF